MFFFRVREQFNRTREPHLLLYLLARIVKGSVRYNAEGHLNQSPDNRRFGMHPHSMRGQLLRVSDLMANRTEVTATDFRAVVTEATDDDVLYLDPPYQGTSFTRDHRYLGGLPYADLVEALEVMNDAEQSYIVSYDGRTGTKSQAGRYPIGCACSGCSFMPVDRARPRCSGGFERPSSPCTCRSPWSSVCVARKPPPTRWAQNR